MSTKRKTLERARHIILWYRREIAALCVAVSVFCVVYALAPKDPASSQVFVANHSLTAGAKLQASDYVEKQIPDEYLPADAIRDADQLAGLTLTANLGEGAVLTDSAVFGSQGSDSTEKLVPFRVEDQQVVSLLKVGDRISVVANSADGTSQTVATGVRVAALPQAESSDFTGAQSGALVVVSADEETANALAVASSQSKLGIVFG